MFNPWSLLPHDMDTIFNPCYGWYHQHSSDPIAIDIQTHITMHGLGDTWVFLHRITIETNEVLIHPPRHILTMLPMFTLFCGLAKKRVPK